MLSPKWDACITARLPEAGDHLGGVGRKTVTVRDGGELWRNGVFQTPRLLHVVLTAAEAMLLA